MSNYVAETVELYWVQVAVINQQKKVLVFETYFDGEIAELSRLQIAVNEIRQWLLLSVFKIIKYKVVCLPLLFFFLFRVYWLQLFYSLKEEDRSWNA